MSINELLFLFNDNDFDIAVWDTDSDTELYRGPACDISEDLGDLRIESLDSIYPGQPLSINVDTSEGLY